MTIFKNNILLMACLVAGLAVACGNETREKMKKVDLIPAFPVVEGDYKMTEKWWVSLPGNFNRRVEEGSLVFWRPGFTVWIDVWGNDRGESKTKRLNDIRADASPERFDEVRQKGGTLALAYRLKEEEGDQRVASFYGFAVGESGHVQAAIYFDDEADVRWAEKIWGSFREDLAE